MPRRCPTWLLLAALVLAVGCGGKEDLRCYVGGTMRPALEELAALFEKETGKHIDVDYDDSGKLLLKIEQTRRGDLYVCHDPFAAALERKGLARQVWTVATLTPTIAVPKGNPKEIRGLRDLGREGLRLGLTDAEYSTLGHICPRMFEKAGVADAVARNVATRSRMGGEVANAVAIGQLDAAIVWNAVIHARREKLDAVPIESQYLPQPGVDAVTSATFGVIDMGTVKVTVATLACSKRVQDATAFARLCDSPRGRAVFARHGFSPSPTPPSEEAEPEAKKAGEARPAGPLYLYCGAGLRLPVAEASEAFQGETGIAVQPDYSGSGMLLSRIRGSRQGDLYLPGEDWYVDRAAELGLVASRRRVCYFVPVILVAKGNPKGLKALSDLTKPNLRLALGDPEVCAIGKVTMQLFEKQRISTEAYRENLVFSALTVNELGVQVKTGHSDAAVVWDAIAAQYADSTEAIVIPPEQNIAAPVAVAVLKFSSQGPVAERFAAFLASDRGQAIFQRHHFTTARPASMSGDRR